MSDEKEGKKKKDAEEAARFSGVTQAADTDLVEWIVALWRNGEKVDVLDCAQVFGKRNITFGNVVHREVFSNLVQLDAETAVSLANAFVGAAQRDCTRMIRKPQTYYVRAYRSAAGAEPISNYPLYVQPKITALTLRDPGASSLVHSDDDDEDGGGLPRADRVSLAYITKMIEAGQFDKQLFSSTFGELLMLSREREKQHYTWIGELMQMNKSLFVEVMTAMRDREAALSSAEDRAIDRDMRKMKMDLLKDGVRTGRNLLTGLFGERMAAAKQTNGHSEGAAEGAANGNGNGASKIKTEEQILLDNFFHDCEATGISIALFGDWKQPDPKSDPVQVTPGIFTKEQLFTLMKVRSGIAPGEMLDDLDPDSGKPLAVTMEQITRAQDVMSEGTAMGLLQLFNLRKRKRAPQPPPPAASNPNAAKEGNYDV